MMPQLADCKAAVVKGLGFGAGKGNKSLVAVARIEKREFITLFGSDADGNAEVVTNKEEVEELKAMIARNHGTTGGDGVGGGSSGRGEHDAVGLDGGDELPAIVRFDFG